MVAKKKKTTRKSTKISEVPSMLSSSDTDWEASSDADTLARAEEIKRDKTRLAKAKKAAIAEAKKVQKKANDLKRIGRK